MNKFEQLIEYVINDEQEKARELFHDIVVEKSREIYEEIMSEEAEEEIEEGLEEELGGSASQDLIDDIEAEEEGMSMEADDMEDEEMIDVDMDMDDTDDEDLEDRVVDLEDKLDELMAEFEELMGTVDVDGDGDHDMDDHKAQDKMDMEMDDEMETEMMHSKKRMMDDLEEAVSLQAAPKPKTSEEGVNAKSPVAANSGARGMDARPVSTDTKAETGRSAPTSKDMGGTTKPDMKAATKPVTAQAGGVNTKSPY